MHVARKSFLPLLFITAFLASCGGQPAPGEPTVDVNATVAAGAQTLVASVFQTQTALAPTITNTAPPTVTALPTTSPLALPSAAASATQGFVFIASSVTPTGTFYTPTPNPSTLSYGRNNLLLIRSYTEPEGPFLPGQSFQQVWQVANTGTCEWLYLYELTFVGGDRMSGNSHRLSDRVPVGEWRKFIVDLEAPDNGGSYSATWRLTDGAGHGFGSNLGVSITVRAPTRTPQPTSYP